jgi:hypothetical protein
MLSLALALGGCSRATAHPATELPAAVAEKPATIRFVNDGREYVHVYLVGAKREWLLGRVEPGAVAHLRVPDEALVEREYVQLAVLPGAGGTLASARDVRTRASIPQTTSGLLSQRWAFSQGQLDSFALRGP